MKKYKIKTLFRAMRSQFLILTPVSIFLGFCTAYVTSPQIHLAAVFLVFVGAVCAHVSVNTFNEYFDFRSGLDFRTSKTPFSGGSGALIDDPKAADGVLYLALVSLGITVLVGIYFICSRGFLILPLGIGGILLILTYTQWLNRHPFLCLLAPGTGFGPLMVVGTHVVLTGEYSLFAFAVSLVPFFLVNNLLLLNQYPDMEADSSVGRRHFPIAYGVRKSTAVYGVFVVAVFIIVITSTCADVLPKTCFIGLIPMAAAIGAFFGAINYPGSAQKLLPYLGMNVIATVLTPALLGLLILHG